MDYVLANKEWIFSGIGVLIVSLIASFIIWLIKKGNISKTQKRKDSIRIINQYGEKSQYIENNEGDIKIN